MKSNPEIIDLFIESLEEMIDARDDMWVEEEHCNYRERWRIEEERYKPSKEKVKKYLTLLLK